MPVKAAKHVVIKYDPEYIKFGFISAGSNAELKAQCVECDEILSQPSLFFSDFSHVFFHLHVVLEVMLFFSYGP